MRYLKWFKSYHVLIFWSPYAICLTITLVTRWLTKMSWQLANGMHTVLGRESQTSP